MMHKLIYTAGIKVRSPEIINRYNFLKKSEKWSIEELEKYQLHQLKRIIDIAYNKSEFYHRLFEKENITPNDIQTLEDIKKIPTISKSDLLNNSEKIQNKKIYRKLFLSETSGSTGEPLVFYRNSEWDAGHRAAQLRGYSWHDVRPWELNGYLWGYSFDFRKKLMIKIYDTLLNRFRLFSYDKNSINQFAKKVKKAVYLEGYSSMIYEVAKLINEHKLGPFDLKMIKGTSEKIYESYQEEVKKAFGQRIVSEYGAAETGIIAYECKEGHMHIVMENVIVEEENGEAIITNLISDSFPIIRYKLGDSIILDNETVCACGMKHKIVKDILGRVGKNIYGKEKKYPSLTLYYIFKNMVIKQGIVLNYQAIQEKKGELIINLEQNIKDDICRKLLEECKNYFSDDVKITVVENSLRRDYNGKFKDFISKISEEKI